MSSNTTNSGVKGNKTQRLFFALWPEDQLRQQIKRHCKTLFRHGGGRPVRIENIHFTLAFLGNVDAQQQECVELWADQIRLSSFEFSIDTAGHWPKPRVLWIGPSETPEVMEALATRLRDGAIQCGIQMDMRPYRAHMTMMRKVRQFNGDVSIPPLVWQTSSFVLVKSVTYSEGVKYEVIREWPLSGELV